MIELRGWLLGQIFAENLFFMIFKGFTGDPQLATGEMKSPSSFTLFWHHFHNTCLCFKGGKMYSEVERLSTRLIMGTNLPVVTLFNDMLLGSAPCWGCDSSPAGPAWWITVGGWWCNHSPTATDTCTSLTPVPSGYISWPVQPTGRHNCSTQWRTKALHLPHDFLWKSPSPFLCILFLCIHWAETWLIWGQQNEAVTKCRKKEKREK